MASRWGSLPTSGDAHRGDLPDGVWRILATLIRLLGDMDLAEEALQDAFAVALEQWPEAGPRRIRWHGCVSTGRHKAIDRLRRRARLHQKRDEIARHLELTTPRSAAVVGPLADEDEERPCRTTGSA